MNTVLITGCSSGYGLETARYFHAEGWNVIATMRTPSEGLLPRSDRMRALALDVTRPESIAAAIEAAGPIDVLVNNAGIGVIGVFEATPMSTIREVFESVVEAAGEREEIDEQPTGRHIVRVGDNSYFLDRNRVRESSVGKCVVNRHPDSIRGRAARRVD